MHQYQLELVTHLQDAWKLVTKVQMSGDKVLLRVSKLPKGWTFKLAKPWVGPYHITKLLSKLVAVIQHINNPRDSQQVNIQCLKPYNNGASLVDSLERLHQQQDSVKELEIKAILNNHLQDSRQQYLLHFKGYTKQYNTWVDHEDINADELLPHYKHSCKIKTASKAVGTLGLQGGM